jgi:hypothetical protein
MVQDQEAGGSNPLAPTNLSISAERPDEGDSVGVTPQDQTWIFPHHLLISPNVSRRGVQPAARFLPDSPISAPICFIAEDLTGETKVGYIEGQ